MSPTELFVFVTLSVAQLQLGDKGTCSATMVAQDKFITAAHCMLEDSALRIGLEEAQAIAIDGALDVALVYAPKSGKRPLRLRRSKMKPGETIAIVGFPYGEGPVMSTGIWASEIQPDGHGFLQGAGAIGMSGAAVVDEKGQFITIAVGVGKNGTGLVFQPDPEKVRKFLRDAGIF